MRCAIRASSEGRAWNGFSARLIDTSGGTISCPGAPAHIVNMHAGPPIEAARRCEGPIHRRLQCPGDIDVVPVGCPTTLEISGPSTFLRIDLTPIFVRSVAESMGINPDMLSLSPQLQLRDPMLQYVASALQAELEAGEPHNRLYAESLGTALAARLLQRYARSTIPTGGLTRRQWQAVVDYVHDNLALDLSLSELASVAGLSIPTFQALFKASVGMPAHRYVVRQRVERAMNLLSGGRAKLSEVAVWSGFVDESHMSRCFLRVVGMTPAAFARECR